MDPQRFQEVAELFEAVRLLPDGERRVRLAAAAPDVRGEVEDLLRQHQADAFLAPPEERAGLLPPGTLLGGYRLRSEIGSGGMGTVYLAAKGDERFALKVLHPHLVARSRFRERFLREAEIGRQVMHENVARTYEVGRDGGLHFLVMEYVNGQTLRELLEELDRVPEELCRHIGREIARGLTAVHAAGAVHRDIKPENVLVTKDRGVKLMDLGIAFLWDEETRLSRTGEFLGSVLYAAPEQIAGKMDGRADLYSLGMLLYELAGGELPYAGADVRAILRQAAEREPRRLGQLNPQLSPFFEEAVHTLIARDPAARFASAGDLLAVLEEGEESGWWRRRSQMIRTETRRPLRRIRIPRETAVYGREGELARLRERYEQAAAGAGRVVLVEGEAGIGKTRLVDELVTLLTTEGQDFHFLYGSYPPGGAATAGGAFAGAFRAQFGSEGLEETLRGVLAETPLLVPAFAALLRGDAPPPGAAPLNQHALETVYVRTTHGLAAERPTVLFIDDLHFASPEGLALFAAIARAAPDHRLLVLGTARAGLPAGWRTSLDQLDHASRISLARLGPKDLGKLLMDAFRSERLAGELSWKIAEKSDGNPYFAFEIIRGLREGRYITRRPDGTWVGTRVIDEIEIPSSIVDLIQARIADLSDEEQELLDVASCCGFEFPPVLVADALGQDRIAALRALGRIEKKHRLVHAAGPNFVFDHHQVQETLYESLSDPLREEYHAALAGALERSGEGAPDGDRAVRLCRHFLKSSSRERALPYLDAAQAHLDGRSLNAGAAELVRRALAEPGLLTGQRRFRALLGQAARLSFAGLPGEEQRLLDEAAGLAETPADRAGVEAQRGWYLLCRARFEEALATLTKASELAREAGDRNLLSVAIGNLGTVCYELGRYEAAKDHHERSLGIAEETADRARQASAHGGLASTLWALGRNEEAIDHEERAVALSREIGDRHREGIAVGNFGTTLSALGRYAEALAYQRRRMEIARELGYRRGEAIGSGNVGFLLLLLGRREEAWRHHERQLRLCREIEHRRGEAQAHLGMGRILEERGDVAGAERRYREAEAITRKLGARTILMDVRRALGGLLFADGRLEEARPCFEEAFAMAQDFRQPASIVQGAAWLARLPDGDVERARALFAEHLDRLGVRARMEASFLLYQATGERERLADARRLLHDLRDRAPEEYRDSMLGSVSIHREIMACE